MEGHNDTVSLGTGTGASDMANLGTSDVANLLGLSQEPMDMLWDGELVHVPDTDESLIAQPPEADIIILDPPSRTPQGG